MDDGMSDDKQELIIQGQRIDRNSVGEEGGLEGVVVHTSYGVVTEDVEKLDGHGWNYGVSGSNRSSVHAQTADQQRDGNRF